jgi:hypothetical protein
VLERGDLRLDRGELVLELLDLGPEQASRGGSVGDPRS